MEEEYVQPPIDAGTSVPMVDATAPPDEERQTFGSDIDGLSLAAEERQALRESENKPIKPIIYKQVGGDHDGEPAPANQTVSAEQAARNLADYRTAIEAQKEQQTDQITAEAIDQVRAFL